MIEGNGIGAGDHAGEGHTRREVVKVGAATAIGAATFLRMGRPRPAFPAGSDELRIGLIGSGKRGTGAVLNAIQAAGAGVRLVAMGDALKDRVHDSLATLKKNESVADKIDVPADRQFAGLDAYEKVLQSDVNYVVIASPPGFKAGHLQAAIAAGKHVFTEKPMAVDGPTVRQCFALADEAARKGLAVGVGLQRHHHDGYLETMKRVRGGQIGDIVGGRCSWLTGALWVKPRQPTWTDLEWQIRNWIYFTWLSGDHIVEQHIHNIDVMNWAIGQVPVAATATGGRAQRTDPAFGNVYDHFSVDFEYPGDVHVQSVCRQIPNCHNDVSEHVVGTKGRADMDNKVFTVKTGKAGKAGKTTWTYDRTGQDPYLQEHVDLIDSIRKGKPLNELRAATESNLAAVMGRMAAYSGKRVTWRQALESQDSLMPAELKWGKMATAPVAIPGATDII